MAAAKYAKKNNIDMKQGLIYKLCSLCVLLNKFVSLLSPLTILNRFLKSLVFRNLHEIPHVWIKKSGIREKSGQNNFPDFFGNGFFTLFCDNKVFFVFQYNHF